MRPRHAADVARAVEGSLVGDDVEVARVVTDSREASPGALFFAYLGLYSLGRFAIEGLRLDSFWVGSLRVPQLASVAGVLIAIAGLVWTSRRSPAVPA